MGVSVRQAAGYVAIPFFSALLATAPSLASTEDRCEQLFSPRNQFNEYQELKSASTSEFEASLQRWMKPAPPEMKPHTPQPSTTTALVVPLSLAPSAAHLEYSVQRASLTSFKDEYEFFRKGPHGTPLDFPNRPDSYAISQIIATRDSVLAIRPNIADGIRTGYGTAPLRAHLEKDGSLNNVGRLFTDPQHPINHLDAAFKQYDLSVYLPTNLIRAVVAFNNRVVPRAGGSDAYFVSPQGKEYPSLSEASKHYAFNNVVALSDTLYIVEVSRTKNPNPQVGYMVVEYEPLARPFRILSSLPIDTKFPIGDVLRDRRNRDAAMGVLSASGGISIVFQSHALFIENGKYTFQAMKFRDEHANQNRNAMETAPTQIDHSIRVIQTQSTIAPELHYLVQHTLFDAMSSPHHLLIRYSPQMKEMVRWDLGHLRLSPVIHRVKNGYVAQQLDPELQDSRRLYYLSDLGGIPRAILPENFSNLGAFSIIDGHLFLIGPEGADLLVHDFSSWR